MVIECHVIAATTPVDRLAVPVINTVTSLTSDCFRLVIYRHVRQSPNITPFTILRAVIIFAIDTISFRRCILHIYAIVY